VPVKLYMDVHIPRAITEQLRIKGAEPGIRRERDGTPDDAHLVHQARPGAVSCIRTDLKGHAIAAVGQTFPQRMFSALEKSRLIRSTGTRETGNFARAQNFIRDQIADVTPPFFEVGRVEEGFGDAGCRAPGLKRAIIRKTVEIASSDRGKKTSVVIGYHDHAALQITRRCGETPVRLDLSELTQEAFLRKTLETGMTRKVNAQIRRGRLFRREVSRLHERLQLAPNGSREETVAMTSALGPLGGDVKGLFTQIAGAELAEFLHVQNHRVTRPSGIVRVMVGIVHRGTPNQTGEPPFAVRKPAVPITPSAPAELTFRPITQGVGKNSAVQPTTEPPLAKPKVEVKPPTPTIVTPPIPMPMPEPVIVLPVPKVDPPLTIPDVPKIPTGDAVPTIIPPKR